MKAILGGFDKKKRHYKIYQKKIAKLESKVLRKSKKDKERLSDISRSIAIDSLIKTTKFNPKTLENAQKVLDNHLFLMNNLDVIKFEDEIDWNYQHTASPNTYSLYMQCLNSVSLLCDAYHETNDRLYLYRSYQILLDWIHFNKTHKENNTFIWKDHPAANRVLNIIYFYSSASEVIGVDESIILELLVEHGNFLMDDGNYVENNHGIMMDRSLIILSIFLDKHVSSHAWFDKGKLRIKNAFYRDFSYKGVHLENSPGYHALIKNMYQAIIRFMKSQKLSLDPVVEAGIRRSNAYLGHIYRPNKKMPIIGDTQQGTKASIQKSFTSFHDPEAGITIFQDRGASHFKSTWLTFICGYSSKTHKHHDDLSTSLYYNGADVLVDSGRYNYDKNSEIRKYLISPKAHSTITVKGKNYSILPVAKNMDLIQTTGFYTNSAYDIVSGIHHAYKGIKLSRTVILLKPNIVLYIDQVKSEQQEPFQQIFNLAPNVEIKGINSREANAHTGNDDMKITQFIPVDKGLVVSADKDVPEAIISERFGQTTDTNQFVFEKQAKEATFLTALTLGSGIKELQDIQFDDQKQQLTVHKKNESIPIFI